MMAAMPNGPIPSVAKNPFAKKGFVDRTIYDTASILATIETRFGLAPLSARDKGAADLRNALETTIVAPGSATR